MVPRILARTLIALTVGALAAGTYFVVIESNSHSGADRIGDALVAHQAALVDLSRMSALAMVALESGSIDAGERTQLASVAGHLEEALVRIDDPDLRRLIEELVVDVVGGAAPSNSASAVDDPAILQAAAERIPEIGDAVVRSSSRVEHDLSQDEHSGLMAAALIGAGGAFFAAALFALGDRERRRVRTVGRQRADGRRAIHRVVQAAASGADPEAICALAAIAALDVLEPSAAWVVRFEPHGEVVLMGVAAAPSMLSALREKSWRPADDAHVRELHPEVERAKGQGNSASSRAPESTPTDRAVQTVVVPIELGNRRWGALAATYEGTTAIQDAIEPRSLLMVFADVIGLALVQQDEAQQNENSELIQTTFAAAPVGLAFIDPDLRVIRANDATTRLVAVAGTGLLGSHLRDLLPHDVVQDAAAVLAMRQVSASAEISLTDTSGRACDLIVSLYPVGLGPRPAVGLGMVVEDITALRDAQSAQRRLLDAEREARDHAERSLRELIAANQTLRDAERRRAWKAELLRAVTELESNAVFAADGDGNLTFVNTVAAGWLRTTPDEAVGRNVTDFVPPGLARRLQARGRLALGMSGACVFDIERPTSTGPRLVTMALCPLTIEGRVFGLAGLARDIADDTDSRRMQERLRVRERAARASAAASIKHLEQQNRHLRELDDYKDELVALISHDLRTPLTSVLGYTELLLRDADALSERHRRHIQVIERNSARLVRLLDDLLLVAQHKAGAFTVIRRPLDLSELAADCLAATMPTAASREVALVSHIEPGVAVEGDAARLAQLLDNLLSNAIKYSPRGGIVEVSVERRDARACLRVRDTGPGISHAEQERIFERFTRASGAADGATGGVGLGLAIAAAIAAAHDGQIGVDSLPGTGSTFWVSLDAMSASPVVEAAGTD